MIEAREVHGFVSAGDLDMIGGKRVYGYRSLVQPMKGQRFGTRRELASCLVEAARSTPIILNSGKRACGRF